MAHFRSLKRVSHTASFLVAGAGVPLLLVRLLLVLRFGRALRPSLQYPCLGSMLHCCVLSPWQFVGLQRNQESGVLERAHPAAYTSKTALGADSSFDRSLAATTGRKARGAPPKSLLARTPPFHHPATKTGKSDQIFAQQRFMKLL